MSVALPPTWRRCKLRELLGEEDVRARDLSDEPFEVLSLTKRNGLIPQTERFEKRVATENVDKYKVVRQGWIAYNPYVVWEGAIHALRRSTPGLVSPAYLVWRRLEDDGGYLDYVLRTPELIATYQSLSAGAVNRRRSINKTAFLDIEVPCPPLEEQRRLAALLSLVRQAITEQTTLVDLALELRSTTLDHLLTNGLHQAAQVETEVGLVPKSWKVARLEELVDGIDYGTSVKCSYAPDGVPVLRIPNVLGGSINLTDLKYGRPKPGELASLALRDGDLLFVRTNGAQENAGRCAMFRRELDGCYFASYLIRVRTNPNRLLPGFLNEYARSSAGKRYLSGRAIRTADGKYNINSGTLRSVIVPLPTLEEQSSIVSTLAVIDGKVVLHRDSLATLTSLYGTLLHQLMTGQLRANDFDVQPREAVPEAAT